MTLSRTRKSVALGVAIAADVLQFPLTAAFIGSVLSAIGLPMAGAIETVDIFIDLVTAVIQVGLLGFHWMLLPTAILEGVPILDLAPTWTACVWWVIRSREKTTTLVPNDQSQPSV